MRNKLILMLALAVAVVLAWRLAPFPLHFEISGQSEPSRTVQQIYFGPKNSLAVLPPQTKDMPESLAWFPDGFAVHLAQRLMEYADLQVISPHSSLRFSPDEVEPRIIAERLVARHLLLAHFTWAEDSLRLEAELRDAKRSEVLWTGEYSAASGQLNDLLHRLEQDVVAAMDADAEPAVAKAIEDDVWLPYLEGLGNLARFEFIPATEAFDRSLEADEAFVPALVEGARARLSGGRQGDDPGVRIGQARRYLETALNLDAENGRALALLSYIHRDIEWGFERASALARRAASALPGDSTVLHLSAQAALSTGQFTDSVKWLEKAVLRDPLNLGLRLALGHAQEFAGDDDVALASYRQALEFNEKMPAAGAYRARIKLLQDKPEVALREAELESDPFWARYAETLARSAMGEDDTALGLLEIIIREDGVRAAYQVAEIHAFRGEIDLAFEWLEKALEYRDGGMTEIAGNRFFARLHGDPRWPSLMEQLGLPLLDSDEESD